MSSKMVNQMQDKQSDQASPSARKYYGDQQQQLFSPKTEGDQPTRKFDGAMQAALSE